MSKFKIIYTILLIFALGLFFGIFFGLGYPEIQRAEYVSTECAIDDKTILSKYCCYKECSTCETASASAPTCTALESQWNSLSPETCGNAVLSNSSLTNVCPINDLKGECDDGYYCCSECCSTCTSCSTSCSGTGSGSSCSTSCTSYSCNCACCSSTNNHSCQIKCPICYSVVLKVTYHDSSYKPITTNITTEYREDLNGAEQFLAKYRVSSTVRCFYNPKNTSQALLFIDYAVKNWVAIGITASFLTIILMYGTWYLFKNNTTIFQGYKYRILMMEIALWCGTIIPPLLVLIDFIPFTNGKILWTLAVIGVTIGWTPIHTIACMKTRGWSFISAFTYVNISDNYSFRDQYYNVFIMGLLCCKV
ncbi:hypothetical protein RclHR1_02140027 [Rhizophagus clarus]|uniref:TNFR-Cys domain-containing protein n=1 Tax=Rhizophagus clarus TaxID=94130 RepID=A0A2Z6R691_9GLOM|nr:hypothetical protein RclHR1_02140027 [Rhizophagus clarus]